MRREQFHLAQANIAKMRAPLDDPVMEGFVSQLELINSKRASEVRLAPRDCSNLKNRHAQVGLHLHVFFRRTERRNK